MGFSGGIPSVRPRARVGSGASAPPSHRSIGREYDCRRSLKPLPTATSIVPVSPKRLSSAKRTSATVCVDSPSTATISCPWLKPASKATDPGATTSMIGAIPVSPRKKRPNKTTIASKKLAAGPAETMANLLRTGCALNDSWRLTSETS